MTSPAPPTALARKYAISRSVTSPSSAMPSLCGVLAMRFLSVSFLIVRGENSVGNMASPRRDMSTGGSCGRFSGADGHRAAVDHDLGARDERGGIGRQEQGALRDVQRLADPAQRDAAPFLRVSLHPLGDVGR